MKFSEQADKVILVLCLAAVTITIRASTVMIMHLNNREVQAKMHFNKITAYQ